MMGRSFKNSLVRNLFWKRAHIVVPVRPSILLCDLYIVHVFPENLAGEKLNVAEVTQCEIAQKQKLLTVLEKINDTLKVSSGNIKWNVDCM